MNKKVIWKQDLLNGLQRAAQVRAGVTMLSMILALVIAGALFDESSSTGGMAAVVFGVPLIVSVLLTQFYCTRKVVCPYCGASLWRCGTGNFKPRRMRVREEARRCPRCEAEIL